MSEFYLGLSYYNRDTHSISGCLSWEGEKIDFPYSSIEEIESEIRTQLKEEYKLQLENPNKDGADLPIYSVEILGENPDEFTTIRYYMPPQKMLSLVNVSYGAVYHLLEITDVEVVTLTAETLDVEIRKCSTCGKPMKEGYYIDGEYACCEECAIALYDGDKAQFEDDLEQDEIHNYGVVYYTEWPDFDLED